MDINLGKGVTIDPILNILFIFSLYGGILKNKRKNFEALYNSLQG